MDYELTGKPDYALVELSLEAGESVVAEPGAMVAMSANVQIKTEMKGGLLGGLKRKLAGENFMTNTFTAEGAPGTIKLAPSTPGDVEAIELSGGTYFLQAGAYIAHVGDIEIDAKFGGAKSFFSGEGFILLKISGTGTLFISSYGGLKKVHVDGEYIVDTTHIVAFPDTIDYKVEAVGGLKATFLSGEGLVCRYRGQGDIFIQTRSGPAFAGWVNPFRAVKKKN
ncbi:MAG: TIGR00266 family protein [Candidatus Lernaella stagnicola]|nr:TIGR00266 family protein [Candidatus Lernaella stagnicola]